MVLYTRALGNFHFVHSNLLNFKAAASVMAHFGDQHSLKAQKKRKKKKKNFLPPAADFYQISLKMKKVLGAQQQAASLSVCQSGIKQMATSL